MRTYLGFAIALGLIVPAAPALADPPRHAPAWGHRAKDNYWDKRRDDHRRYDRRITRNDRVWYRDGRYHCRRSDGTTGLVIGAAVGGLAGYGIGGSENRTLGTIIGAGAGALLGREIDRGDLKCR